MIKKVNITKKKHILLCYCLFIDFLAYYENLTTKSKLNWRLNNSSVNAEMCVLWSLCTKRTCSGLWLKSLRAQRVLTKTQTQKLVFTFLCRYKWSKWLKSSWMVNPRDWHEINFVICGYLKTKLEGLYFSPTLFPACSPSFACRIIGTLSKNGSKFHKEQPWSFDPSR